MKGYWNGEECEVRKVVVEVGHCEPKWWCYKYMGLSFPAVEVTYRGQTFFIADDTGHGWDKVQGGNGSPWWGHKSLPDDSTVILERDE